MSGLSILTRGMICLPVTEGQLIICNSPDIDSTLELKPDVVSYIALTPTITTTPIPAPVVASGTPEISTFTNLKPSISNFDQLTPTVTGTELVPSVTVTDREED